jgi:Kef-type K+ transport system membrane component KefB
MKSAAVLIVTFLLTAAVAPAAEPGPKPAAAPKGSAATAASGIQPVEGTPQQLREKYAKTIAELLPGLEANDQKVFQKLDALALHSGRPGAELERAACCRALTAALESVSSVQAKDWIVRQLTVIGRAESVQLEAKLLAGPDLVLRETARNALQHNPSRDAAKILRNALEQATDPLWQAALALALGARRDDDAIPALDKLCQKQDEKVQVAVLAALADIGSPGAAIVLNKARQSVLPQLRNNLAEARLKCADQCFARHPDGATAAIYQEYTDSSWPPSVRLAALTGVLRTAGPAQALLVNDYLRSGDADKRAAALEMVAEVPILERMADTAGSPTPVESTRSGSVAEYVDASWLLGRLAVLLAAIGLFGAAAQWLSLPAMLGEIVAGVVLGRSLLGWIDPQNDFVHLAAEVGLMILMIDVGLKTDLKGLLKASGSSLAVGLVAGGLSYILVYGAARLWGLDGTTASLVACALTATSVGVTARALVDLKRLSDSSSQVLLVSALINYVAGLVLFAVATAMGRDQGLSPLEIAEKAALILGFLVVCLVVGAILVGPITRLVGRINLHGTSAVVAVGLALGLAWLASISGSVPIMGTFAAGLLLRRTPLGQAAEKAVGNVGSFFVPVFFVALGAAVDLRVFNFMNPACWPTFCMGGFFLAAAVVGKLAGGFAPFWLHGNKLAVGVGMIPRGEIGLVFAQLGLTIGVFDAAQFSAVTMVVVLTTFLTPLLLRIVYPPKVESSSLRGAGERENPFAGTARTV